MITGDSNVKLTECHSYYSPRRFPKDSAQNVWKSDINLIPSDTSKQSRNSEMHFHDCAKSSSGEYYKRYEHDEIPVKDGHTFSDATFNLVDVSTRLKEKTSLTNSDLDKLERKVLQNVSQELQTDGSSFSSLDSNIKFFKTTVQQIFDNFHTAMQDIEQYKKRFHDILAKNQDDSIMEMENFIKDMIQHIISSESVSTDGHKSVDQSTLEGIQETNLTNSIDTCTTNSRDESNKLVKSVVEAYKNENYFTDSTFDDNNSQIKRYTNGEIFNIYLLNANPCLEIKMNDRNLLSEINIKNPSDCADPKNASADNFQKLAAKKTELENYVKTQQDQWPDRDIPVRISSAKKNIFLNEDFNDRDKGARSKSFMSKLCNFLCKKFRKNSIS